MSTQNTEILNSLYEGLVVTVKFDGADTAYRFKSLIAVNPGDRVVVQTAHSMTTGTAVEILDETALHSDLQLDFRWVLGVVRKEDMEAVELHDLQLTNTINKHRAANIRRAALAQLGLGEDKQLLLD